jgi:hypothetical protein
MVSSGDLSRMVRLGREEVTVEDRVDNICVARGGALTGAKADEDATEKARIRAAVECFMVPLIVVLLFDEGRNVAIGYRGGNNNLMVWLC